jgi:hypothetical protein
VAAPGQEQPVTAGIRNADKYCHSYRFRAYVDAVRAWGDKAIADIDREDVLAIIKLKKRTAPAEARSQLTASRCSARSTPMRPCISGPRPSAARISTSVAVRFVPGPPTVTFLWHL